MNAEQIRQIEAHKARRARMGAPVSPSVPVVAKPAPVSVVQEKKHVRLVIQFTPPSFESLPLSDRIIHEVAYKHLISTAQMKSPSRRKAIVRARWEASYRIYNECAHLSLTQIGWKLGNRDHTTILHGIREYARMNNLPMPSELRSRAA